ncbi:hypothetical protein C8J57DRAFT_1512344 [Mycena rebaudengoi]|nr:hypothetical protein C8J57DRAFT_1512344 [Mycena rebaudengoi]
MLDVLTSGLGMMRLGDAPTVPVVEARSAPTSLTCSSSASSLQPPHAAPWSLIAEIPVVVAVHAQIVCGVGAHVSFLDDSFAFHTHTQINRALHAQRHITATAPPSLASSSSSSRASSARQSPALPFLSPSTSTRYSPSPPSSSAPRHTPPASAVRAPNGSSAPRLARIHTVSLHSLRSPSTVRAESPYSSLRVFQGIRGCANVDANGGTIPTLLFSPPSPPFLFLVGSSRAVPSSSLL